ncbi:DUF4259 domain-containing protein [Kitasatospora sp. A2-31]|uniref:DUF4259 domain-containing protein n=1 Tax=Kitasatospora sp. A2-31 TaxID=2916414 RepID=UPI001EEA52D6|nr:DUF4259 domain-containing protein [Kitasatospora sp. A2-31]MCG6496954.1 DUF4259 domain-containing protein [Kitasatospora sp. A2-31]
MGTWGIGPFDSDHAEQFGDEVDHALPDARHAVIEERLTRYLAGGQGYRLRDEAVAAAFLVAAQYPGGADAVASGHRPKQPIPDLPQHLRPMAARALDRVLGDVQFDMDAWNRAGQREVGEQWLDGLERLRTVLDPDTPYTVAYTPGPLLRHEIGTGRALRELGVDRLRALPGYGDDRAAGQLVRRIVEAAAQLDQAHKDVQAAADLSLQALDAVRSQLHVVALGASGDFHPRDVPAYSVSPALGPAMAQRADRHRHLTALLDLYRATTAPADESPRATAARTRTAAAAAAESPSAASPPPPTAEPRAARRR